MHLTKGHWGTDIVGRAMATFTALNGGESKTSEGVGGNPAVRHVVSEDRSAVQITSQEAKTGEASVAQMEQGSSSAIERPRFQSTAYSEVEGPQKRKRSVSAERHREATSAQEPDRRSQVEPRGSYEVSPREREYRHYGEEQRERAESWYSQHPTRDDRILYESREPAGSVSIQGDEQTGENQRRGTSRADSMHDYPATSPDGDDSMLYSGSYSQDQSRDPVIQSDPKKRKRNFSNRTKTGCLTCRKRKKKCDETKPQCTNCLRGGFVCYGYPNQRGHPKLENKPVAVPLESKDPSYVPPGAYGMPQPSTYTNPSPAPATATATATATTTTTPTTAHAPSHAPTPAPAPAPAPKRDSVSFRGPFLRVETSHPRSVLTDDDRPTASTIPTASAVSSILSPENTASAFSAYTNAANMFPTPISANTPSMQQLKTPNMERPREYQRVPPLHDITRTEPDMNRPDSPRTGLLPQMSVLGPTPPIVSNHHPPPSADPKMAAQLALSHTQYPPNNNNKARTQKEEMLIGREYYPFDSELVLERQRCSAACWRFNNSTNPNTGVSATERSRLFREILNPREPINLSPQLLSSITKAGRVGNEVVVEAPFTCDYGYNITIGNKVLIGRNCTILDPMEIIIGEKCFIGPNVTLLGATTFEDPNKRKGSRSPQIGGYIYIDEDVWIGAGAIIQHNIRVGRGSVIQAGAVVTKDVPRYTIVGGNPAEVRSGIPH